MISIGLYSFIFAADAEVGRGRYRQRLYGFHCSRLIEAGVRGLYDGFSWPAAKVVLLPKVVTGATGNPRHMPVNAFHFQMLYLLLFITSGGADSGRRALVGCWLVSFRARMGSRLCVEQRPKVYQTDDVIPLLSRRCRAAVLLYDSLRKGRSLVGDELMKYMYPLMNKVNSDFNGQFRLKNLIILALIKGDLRTDLASSC